MGRFLPKKLGLKKDYRLTFDSLTVSSILGLKCIYTSLILVGIYFLPIHP